MSKKTMADVINVMLSGLPGKMASLVAKFILSNNDMNLHDFALTGSDIEQSEWVYSGESERKIHLIKPDLHEKTLSDLVAADKHPIIIDFTQQDAVNKNADLYCKYGMPFVIGTTSGDRKKLEETVKSSETSAVIAPNMGKQIVVFQAMMQYAAENFPNAFKDYKLEIRESHQKNKKDASGTARAMTKYFKAMGIDLDTTAVDNLKLEKPEDITLSIGPCSTFEIIRGEDTQKSIGVPEEYRSGHGWHTYKLKSKDGTVLFEFVHNVNGRLIYAEGTLDAIRYLHKKIKEGSKGQVYSMMDVLKGA